MKNTFFKFSQEHTFKLISTEKSKNKDISFIHRKRLIYIYVRT